MTVDVIAEQHFHSEIFFFIHLNASGDYRIQSKNYSTPEKNIYINFY